MLHPECGSIDRRRKPHACMRIRRQNADETPKSHLSQGGLSGTFASPSFRPCVAGRRADPVASLFFHLPPQKSRFSLPKAKVEPISPLSLSKTLRSSLLHFALWVEGLGEERCAIDLQRELIARHAEEAWRLCMHRNMYILVCIRMHENIGRWIRRSRSQPSCELAARRQPRGLL